ncbi:MAG: glycosyltransferase [Acidobacteria bacterium]|nr:glycosyltransferase [Acidobacteriota bacterium]
MTGGPPVLAACPLCGHESLAYQFTHLTTSIVRCRECGLLMRNPQPSDAELAAIYTETYFLGSGAGRPGEAVETDRLKRATAARQLSELEARMGGAPPPGLRLLELGCGRGNLLVEAQARGYDVTGVDYSESSVRTANDKLGAARVRRGTLQSVGLADQSFDVVVMADVLEHTRQPLEELCEVWRVLKPGGWLFLAVPSLDSWSAKLMRERWVEFKLEHLYFFDRRTAGSLVFRAGFEQVSIASGWKTLSAEYVIHHFERFPVPLLSPLASLLGRMTPPRLRRRHVRVIASGIDLIARRSFRPPPARRALRLTVIMPVYNEQPTFRRLFDQVHAKALPGVDIDIIVVESGSTDGSSEAVDAVAGLPRVRVLHEPRAYGKGHAVRAALALADGDLILIQDADLEYDVNDYEQLVAPLASGRAAVVLGARHDPKDGSWKMRRFSDDALLSALMGFGHTVFRVLFNVVYGTRLRDPFTMFKVFRRDCLYGLTFESNRFDFDWELVAKLVRAGYAPIEIPVNYSSRSFKEGKKVSFWRDPFTYFRACFKYRFVRLGK